MLKNKKFPPKADLPAAEKGKRQECNLKVKNFDCGLAFCLLSFTFYLLLFTFCDAQEQFVYDTKGKRDPFIPLVTPEGRLLSLDTQETKGALTLEGIIYDAKGVSYAVVNGAVVKIGDTIDGIQVLRIEDKKVVFIKDGNPFEMGLKEE